MNSRWYLLNPFNTFTANERRVIGMATLGGALEFYDFIIFIFLAKVISPQYFPAEQPIYSLIGAFAAFAVGYLARPIGGLVFSHLGDTRGRKQVFYYSIMLMALPTLLIALLPTYHQVGILAPIGMLLLRIVQGLAVGGEIPGAITFTFEHVAPTQRNLAIVLILLGMTLATLFGQIIVSSLMFLLSSDQFFAWGWRITFFIGAMLGLIGGYLRKNLGESPLFISLKAQGDLASTPLIQLCRQHPKAIVNSLAMVSLCAVSMLLLFMYMPIYLATNNPHLGGIGTLAHGLNTIHLITYTLALLLAGYLGDRWPRKWLLRGGAAMLLLWSPWLFTWLITGTPLTVMLALSLLGMSFAAYAGCFAVVLAEQFPTAIRYTGISLSYNIAFALFGGTTPLVVTLLIQYTHSRIAPAYYLMCFALLGLLSTLFSTNGVVSRER